VYSRKTRGPLGMFRRGNMVPIYPKNLPLFTPLLSCSVPQARCPDKGVQ